ncbi:MAG: hypothetical protein IPL32_17025 [Chloracidobacterium sp.]|nr:hypothetical protein [Chloracidobacterium sp.]
MSKQKKQDDGYPFDTGDWARWTNVKRLNWMRNFRDRLLDEGASTHYFNQGLTEADMMQIIADTAAMEKVVEQEQAAMKMMQAGLAQEMNTNADELLKSIDNTGRKAIYLPPNDILGKKGN